MSKFYSNVLSITCNAASNDWIEVPDFIESLIKIEDLVNFRKLLDFSRIIPEPEHTEEASLFMRQWRMKNWGTSKEGFDVFTNGRTVWFTTEDTPCIPVIAALAEQHPECIFRYSFSCVETETAGARGYEDGRLTFSFKADSFEETTADIDMPKMSGWSRVDVAIDRSEIRAVKVTSETETEAEGYIYYHCCFEEGDLGYIAEGTFWEEKKRNVQFYRPCG